MAILIVEWVLLSLGYIVRITEQERPSSSRQQLREPPVTVSAWGSGFRAIGFLGYLGFSFCLLSTLRKCCVFLDSDGQWNLLTWHSPPPHYFCCDPTSFWIVKQCLFRLTSSWNHWIFLGLFLIDLYTHSICDCVEEHSAFFSRVYFSYLITEWREL